MSRFRDLRGDLLSTSQRNASQDSPESRIDLDEQALGELLRRATPRAAVPLDHWRAAHEAAREAWQEQVRRRRRRRVMLGWGLAAAVLGAVWLMGWGAPLQRLLQSLDKPSSGVAPAVEVLARLDVVHGDVRWQTLQGLEDGAGELALTAGTTLDDRGWLTTDATSRAAVRLAGGQSLRVDVETRLRLDDSDSIWLEKGAVYVDSQSAASLEVRSRHGVARDIGTQFEVRLERDELRLRVREGEVRLSSGGQEHAALPGDELRLGDQGPVRRGAVALSDEGWSWSLAVAPPFALEGSTLDDFLAWVTRENGWRLRFEDAALEVQATTIELHGSLENVPLDQAAAMVLATCGLEHDLQDGALVVRRP